MANRWCGLSRFPTASHLASWAGLCPGNNESAGKRKSGRTRKANRWLKAALTQSAWGASRTRRSYFSVQHRRLTTRRGVKRASIAVAHSLLRVAYELISHPDLAYTDLGTGHFDRRPTVETQVQQLIQRLHRLGCSVEVKHPAA